MKITAFFRKPALAAVALTSAAISTSNAATVIWGGGDGEYTTGSNWAGGSVPNTNGGDTARIDSGAVTYTPGGDLHVHGGGSLVINGGSWTQTGGIAWIQLAGGSLSVAGGTFNQGTSGNIVRDATTTINISSGTANFSGNFLNQASYGLFSLTGGTVNVANEFKPIDTFSMTTGSLIANLISFADGPGSINISGGTISVNGGGAYSGFYGGGTKSLNFPAGSAGTLFISSYTLADLVADNFLTNGTIRYDDAISASAFSAIESAGGVLIAPIPETSPSLLLLGGIGVVLLKRHRKRC